MNKALTDLADNWDARAQKSLHDGWFTASGAWTSAAAELRAALASAPASTSLITADAARATAMKFPSIALTRVSEQINAAALEGLHAVLLNPYTDDFRWIDDEGIRSHVIEQLTAAGYQATASWVTLSTKVVNTLEISWAATP